MKIFLTIITLLALFCLLGCADTEHPLTEDEIESLIDARVAEEIAKMNGDHEVEIAEKRFTINGVSPYQHSA